MILLDDQLFLPPLNTEKLKVSLIRWCYRVSSISNIYVLL